MRQEAAPNPPPSFPATYFTIYASTTRTPFSSTTSGLMGNHQDGANVQCHTYAQYKSWPSGFVKQNESGGK
jgi:hypothetical protein